MPEHMIWRLVRDDCKLSAQTVRHLLEAHGIPYESRNAPDGEVYVRTPHFVLQVGPVDVTYADPDSPRYGGSPDRPSTTDEARTWLTVPTPTGGSVRYEPWTDGYAIGFRATRDDGSVEYLYLNPSNNDDGSDVPNVFVYSGPHGDPARDRPFVHFVQFEEEA